MNTDCILIRKLNFATRNQNFDQKSIKKSDFDLKLCECVCVFVYIYMCVCVCEFVF